MKKKKILKKLDRARKAKDCWQEAAMELFEVIQKHRNSMPKAVLKSADELAVILPIVRAP